MRIMVMLLEEKKKKQSEVNSFCDFGMELCFHSECIIDMV